MVKEKENLERFIKTVCLERMQVHCENKNLEFIEDAQELHGKVWTSGIFWGSEDLNGIIIINFTTLNILAMASSVFTDTDDSNLFEHAKDFMKEYCNFYAGYIKGIFKNNNVDVKISLPIISSGFDSSSCFGGHESDISTKWFVGTGKNYVSIEGHIHLSKDFDINQLKFLDDQLNKQETKKENKIEFF